MVLKTAVVGAGTVSDIHLTGLTECPRTDLVAVCDIDRDAAMKKANEYGIKPYFGMTELLSGEDLDWIHICTSVQSHLDLARMAIEAGVPVQIEKPITETVAEVDELQSLSEQHGVPVSVVHQHHFDPVVRKVKAQIDAGAFGTIRGVDAIYSGFEKPDEVHRGAWAFDLPGGEFEEGLPHPLYMTMSFGGFPASRDHIAATTSRIDTYDRDFWYDGAQLQYATADGTLCSTKMIAGSAPQSLIVVHGDEQSVTIDLVSQTAIPVKKNFNGSPIAKARNNLSRAASRLRGTFENVRMVVEERRSDSWEATRDMDPHYGQFDAEARAIEQDTQLPVTLEEARWSIVMMEVIREAAETDRTRQASEPLSTDGESPRTIGDLS